MGEATNTFSPEVRERAVQLVLKNEAQHPSRWQAVMLIAVKIGCTPRTLSGRVKKIEVDSGQRAGIPTVMAEKMKAQEREKRDPENHATGHVDGAVNLPLADLLEDGAKIPAGCIPVIV